MDLKKGILLKKNHSQPLKATTKHKNLLHVYITERLLKKLNLRLEIPSYIRYSLKSFNV